MPNNQQFGSHLGGEEWRDMDSSQVDYRPEDQADFLKECDSRIDQHRKREVALRLTDRTGKALTGVEVEVEMLRHAFPFGDQLWPLDAMVRDGEGNSGKARAWKQRFAEVFNAATSLCYWTERPRNDASKTEDQQGDWRIENFADTVDWTLSEGMRAKGHPLFWSIPKCVPDWVLAYDYETRMKFAEVRIRNLVARFKGQVTIWDAINEPMWEATFKNIHEREWPHIEAISDVADMIEPVMTWCREEDPDALYLVNDYGMEESKKDGQLTGNDGSNVTAASQRERFIALFEELLRRNCAPDAVGLQAHTGWVPHERQWAIYDQFANATGLPVHITEFWAHTDDLRKSGKFSDEQIQEIQAAYIGNTLTAAFAHPAIEGFFFWGFMNTALRWTERSGHDTMPAFSTVRDLIQKTWRTHEKLTTDDEGVVRFRGFFGEYSLRHSLTARTTKGLTFTVSPALPDGPLTLVSPVIRA